MAVLTDGSVWRSPLGDLTAGSRRLGSVLATDVDGNYHRIEYGIVGYYYIL